MAWELQYTSRFGTVHSAAYARITFFALDRGDATIRSVFNVYADAGAAAANAEPLGQVELRIAATPLVIKPEEKDADGNVISPAIMTPPFASVISAITEPGRLYDGVAKLIYQMSAALPQFQGAKGV